MKATPFDLKNYSFINTYDKTSTYNSTILAPEVKQKHIADHIVKESFAQIKPLTSEDLYRSMNEKGHKKDEMYI
jgi:hypothetical protein